MSQPGNRATGYRTALAGVCIACLLASPAAAERLASHASLISRLPVAHADALARTLTQGQGEPVFILPGQDEPLDSWRSLLGELGERFEATAIEWTADDVTDSRALMGRVESLTREPIHLVGEGEGARLAMRLAMEYPDRVRSLVLAAPEPRWFARDAAVEGAREGASLPADVDTLLSARRLGRISVPVLVLNGDRDERWTGETTSRDWIRVAREQSIRGAGTRPHIHASIEFNRAIARFLERQRMTAGEP